MVCSEARTRVTLCGFLKYGAIWYCMGDWRNFRWHVWLCWLMSLSLRRKPSWDALSTMATETGPKEVESMGRYTLVDKIRFKWQSWIIEERAWVSVKNSLEWELVDGKGKSGRALSSPTAALGYAAVINSPNSCGLKEERFGSYSSCMATLGWLCLCYALPPCWHSGW